MLLFFVACGSAAAPAFDESAANLEQIRLDIASTREKLDEKRRARDVVWVQCLNDKLASLKTTLDIAERRNVDLKAAIAARDMTDEAHARNAIDVLRRRADALTLEGASCV